MRTFVWALIPLFLAVSCRPVTDACNPRLCELDENIGKRPRWASDSLSSPRLSSDRSLSQDYLFLLRKASEAACGRTDSTGLYLDSLLHAFQEVNVGPFLLGRIHYFLGCHMQRRERFSRADYHYSKSVANMLSAEGCPSLLIGVAYYHLAQVRYKQRVLDDAEEYCRKALGIFQEKRDTFYIASLLVQQGLVRMKQGHLRNAQADLVESLRLFSSFSSSNDSMIVRSFGKAIESYGRVLLRKGKLDSALKFGLKNLDYFREHGISPPSTCYYFLMAVSSKAGRLDEAGRYCRMMMETARQEQIHSMVYDGFRVLTMLELKGGTDYQKAYEMNMEYNRFKDSLKVLNYTDNLLEFEKNYLRSEAERAFYREKTLRLQFLLYMILLFSLLLSLSLFLYFRQRKLKVENIRLSASERHSRWGFSLTKEFISENHIAYDQLERVLAREKGRNNINADFYNCFHELLLSQKNTSSIHMIESLAGTDHTFIVRLRQTFPDLTADEIFMSVMIHHGWDIPDMMTVLHISLEAVRKRKLRLSSKVSRRLGEGVEIDTFLVDF